MEWIDLDLALVGVASEVPVYEGMAARRARFEGSAALRSETKSVATLDPLLDMQSMLMEMTKELRERFQHFQAERVAAERDAEAATEAGARKVAQADAKAAIEAVSLIVRTLEKIDSLQRVLINERSAAEEAEALDDRALVAEFERLVAEKVAERVDVERQRWETEQAAAGGDRAGGEGSGAGEPQGETQGGFT